MFGASEVCRACGQTKKMPAVLFKHRTAVCRKMNDAPMLNLQDSVLAPPAAGLTSQDVSPPILRVPHTSVLSRFGGLNATETSWPFAQHWAPSAGTPAAEPASRPGHRKNNNSGCERHELAASRTYLLRVECLVEIQLGQGAFSYNKKAESNEAETQDRN